MTPTSDIFPLFLLLCSSPSSSFPSPSAAGAQFTRLWGPQTDQVWPLPADKIQRQRDQWWQNQKGISVSEANPGKTAAHGSKAVSRVLKILPGLFKEHVGQRSTGLCRWAVKVRSLSWSQSWAESCWLRVDHDEGAFWVPCRGCFTLRVFCLSPGTS